MTDERYSSFTVDVGGEAPLHVGCWGDRGDGLPVVVAAHGITATHMEFPALAEALAGEVTLVAPDLRGRGRSRDVGGPYGMERHADDVVAVLDHVGVDQALVVGHSMGGFVAVVTAHRHPDRVARLVLVDGGIPLRVPEGLPVDQLIEAVIGPAATRLSSTFATVDDYLDFWRPHPALAGDQWNDRVETYIRYDLVGEPPELRASCRIEALHADTEDTLRDGVLLAAVEALAHPAVLVRAPRGLFDEEPPLYPDEWLDEWKAKLPELRDVLVPDCNHYTIVISDEHSGAVAEVVRKELASL